jgi:excisionase family DNA binding protein
MNDERPRGYTVPQVAQLLQLPDKQVYALIHRGELAAVKVGRHFRIPDHALERLLHSADADVA